MADHHSFPFCAMGLGPPVALCPAPPPHPSPIGTVSRPDQEMACAQRLSWERPRSRFKGSFHREQILFKKKNLPLHRRERQLVFSVIEGKQIVKYYENIKEPDTC